MNQQTHDFILKYANEDVNTLALKASSFPEVDIPLALRQIEGRQKVKAKIPTFYDCPTVLYPVKLSLEQSSSEITARYKSSLCRGEKLVDLTGGFGIDSYFFSENFNKVVYVERQEELCTLAAYNYKELDKANIQIINQSAEDFLKNDVTADWIYLDPARRKESGAKAVLLSHCEPNVAELQHALLERAENVMVKLSPMFDLAQLQRELQYIREIHVVAVENECKEILVLLQRGFASSVTFKAVHFPKNKAVEVFELTEEEEKLLIPMYAEVMPKYLYEPNAAILKVGAFKSIGNKYLLHKLHINSHLYVSEKLVDDFPGRIFEIKEVFNFNKTELKKLNINQANLSARNFPLTVNELRKKLKIKEGGSDYIFATTLHNGQKALILCEKQPLR